MDSTSPVFISKVATEHINKLLSDFDRLYPIKPALIPYIIDIINNLRPYIREDLYLKIMERCHSIHKSSKIMPGIKIAGNIFELIEKLVNAKPENFEEIKELDAKFRSSHYSKNSDIICRIYDEAYENYQKTLSN